MVAEGDPLNISEVIDTSGLVGSLSSTIHWGDGRESSGDVGGGTGSGDLKIRFDYSLDTNGFFKSASRRSLLQTAADGLVQRFTDDLTAISPSGSNSWDAIVLHPATGNQKTIANPTIQSNEIVVYAGARDLSGSRLGEGGPGAWSASGTQSWLNTVKGRGEAGALKSPPTDVAPWGGSVAFDTAANWYFGTDADGLGANQDDFMTVAQHELAHLLGFGVGEAWSRLVSAGKFTGSNAQAAYDGSGSVPLSSSRSHFADDLEDNGQEALMTSTVGNGTRKLVTPLDLAALDDIGWDVVADAQATVTAEHTYADDGTYPVEVVVRGNRYGEVVETLSTHVTNVAPELTVVSDQTVVQGQPLSLSDLGQISDPGYRNLASAPATEETFTYSVNWGDGTAADAGSATIDRFGSADAPTLASFDGSHTYSAAGGYTVTVVVNDDDGGSARETFSVNVVEPPQLTLQLEPATVAENEGSGAATLTVTRSGPASASDQTVSLTSSDTSEATVPASVVIPAGKTFVTTDVQAVDDTLLDGDQTVELSATASGLNPGAVDLVVADHEFLEASFNQDSVREDAAVDALRLTIARSNTDVASALEVSVSGGDPGQLDVPATVTIPAGEQEVELALTPTDDELPEAPDPLTFTFVAGGYTEATAAVTVVDDEPPLFQNPDNRFDVNDNQQVTALDALRVINELNRRGGPSELDPSVEQPAENFYDTNGDYQITALDALLVINELNRQSAASGEPLETEAVSEAPLRLMDEATDEDADSSINFPIAEQSSRWSLF